MENLEKIAMLDSEAQVELLESILSEREIPHVLKCYHDSALDGLFQGQRGWGHIEAPAEFRDEILAILKDLERDVSVPEDPGQGI